MSLAAAGVLRRAALNAVRLNTFRAAPARTLSAGPKKPAAELTFKEAWLSDPATYPIVVIISSPYPASVKQRNHDQKSTSLYRGPCDRGAVVSWESTSVAAPKGQKGLFERAFYESRLRGRPRDSLCTTQPRSSAASATAPSASSARRTCASPRRRGRRSLEIGRRRAALV